MSLYHYKARAYDPIEGRFLQTDHIGYGDGLNMYAYVGNDPLNMIDPTGLSRIPSPKTECPPDKEDGVETCDVKGFIIRPLMAWDFSRDKGTTGGSGGNVIADKIADKIQEVVVTLKKQHWYGPHYYRITRVTGCAPSTAFRHLQEEGRSAPMAPKADRNREDVSLFGGNSIRQSVDSKGLTIINQTNPTHIFHNGNVTLTVKPYLGGSVVDIVGVGTGKLPSFNNFIGETFFGNSADYVKGQCGAFK